MNNKYLEKRLEDSRMYGKSTRQGMFLLECIYKGEEYAVFESIKNRVHIIPDKKLKEIINQALAEERKRVRENLPKIITPTVEPPPNNLSQNQIFAGGQMNMLLRVTDLLESFELQTSLHTNKE